MSAQAVDVPWLPGRLMRSGGRGSLSRKGSLYVRRVVAFFRHYLGA
jgi:hypothetical protein